MLANQRIQSELIGHQIKLTQKIEKLKRQLVGKINKTNEPLADYLKVNIRKLPNNTLSRKFQGSLNTMGRRVHQIRKTGNLNPNKITGIGLSAAEAYFTDEMRILAENEANYVKKLIHSEVAIPFTTTIPQAERMRSLVAFAPFQGETIQQWFKTLGNSDTSRIMRTVRSGIIEDKGTAGITKDIFKTDIPRTMRSAEMLARTCTNGIANESKMDFYEQNKDIIKGVIFVATLDGRTSIDCAALDGQVWEDLSKAEQPPIHPNCRSLLSPYMSAEGLVGDRISVGDRNFRADAKKEYIEKWVVGHGETLKEARVRWNNLDTGTINGYMNKSRNDYMKELNKNVIGKVPVKVNYSEWLKKQDKHLVESVLGKRKAEEFLSGKSTLKSFSNRG